MVTAGGETGRGYRISKQFLCSIWKKRNERPNVGGVSIRSRNGAPSRKGRVVPFFVCLFFLLVTMMVSSNKDNIVRGGEP